MSRRIKIWSLRLAASLAVLVLLAWLTGAWLVRKSIAQPPPLPADISVMRLKPETRDGKVWLGKSWTGQREGLRVVCLRGNGFERGYAEGVLLHEQMHTLETEFLEMVHGYVPQDWKVNVLKNYVMYRNRHLSDFVPLDYRMEIFGLTLGCPDIHPKMGAYYNRLLNYHAAHDVSYMLIDNPLVSRAGCTSFGAWGEKTEHGHLLTGRNFDWEAAEVFSRDRVVLMFEPDGGIPFISLAWAGMAGVVSGMNREGVSVTVNGAPSSLPGETATPVAIVARELLERSHNLAEALALLKSAKVFVSTIWLVGSRADGRFVVVEKTPAGTYVRQPEKDWIICANHFETPELAGGGRNQSQLAEATSLSRENRLRELIEGAHVPLGPTQAIGFLRDRKLPQARFAGNGHRAALNALIATHAVVMDLTDGIFWAASPPNQLGKFVAFDLRDFTRELPELTIESDQALASGEFERARAAKKCLMDGELALKQKHFDSALSFSEKAQSLNPGFYQNAALRGRALLGLGRRDEAARAFESALGGSPAFLQEKKELETLLAQSKMGR